MSHAVIHAGAQEQADEAMEDAAPEGATTPTAEQDAAMRTEGLEQTAKGFTATHPLLKRVLASREPATYEVLMVMWTFGCNNALGDQGPDVHGNVGAHLIARVFLAA